MEKEEKKSGIIAKVLSIISMAFLILCVGILVYSTISYSKNGLVNFFGYSFHVIQTESMEPEIKVGDLVIVKKVPYSEIKIGDDILFKCEDTTSQVYGKYIVHRVVDFTENEGVYITRGINNPLDDVTPSKAEGKVVKVSSAFGKVFSFLTNSRNLVIIIVIIGLLIFTFLQVCSVIANAAKVKEEKEKEKLQKDEELKEKIKQELLEELQNQDNNQLQSDDANRDATESQIQGEQSESQNINEQKADTINSEDDVIKNNDTGSEDK